MCAALLTLPLALAAVGCNPEEPISNEPLITANNDTDDNSNSNSAGNDNANANTDGNENGNDAGNNTPTSTPFTDPWTRAKIGDLAIYRTGEVQVIWRMTEAGSNFVISKEEELDPASGIEPRAWTDTVDRSPNPARPAWWTLATREEAETVEVTLPGGDTIEAMRFTVDEYGDTGDRYTFTVSDAVPFDGIVSISVNGGDPTRELVSFSRAD